MNRRLLMWILWPAFLAAALAELVVFSMVDPADLRFSAIRSRCLPKRSTPCRFLCSG